MVFQQKALEKADFTDKMTGPAIGDSGAAGQFLQTQSALKDRLNLWFYDPRGTVIRNFTLQVILLPGRWLQ